MKSQLQRLFAAIRYQYHLLPHRPRLWWHQLWVREDEFHHSLNMDVEAMVVMNATDRQRYLADLCRRRDLAHNLDMLEWPVAHMRKENFILRAFYAYRAKRLQSKLKGSA